MRIALVTYGSRGDIQPYIALGKGLQLAGHDVRVVTHDNFADFVCGEGLTFFPVGNDIQAVQKSVQQVTGSDKTPDPFWQALQGLKVMEPYFHSMIEKTWEACQGMDVLVGNVLGVLNTAPMAHKLNIRSIAAYAQPLLATREFPGLLAPSLPPSLSFLRPSYNLFMSHLTLNANHVIYETATKKARGKVIGPMPPASVLMRKNSLPQLHGYSEHFIPRPKDWPANAHVTGYWFLDTDANWQPPTELSDFLQAGPAPISMGFGSMNSENPEQMAEIGIEALKKTKQRGIIITGWGGIKPTRVSDEILMIDAAPHDWLFPRMRTIIHHGGAGTTGASLRAGVPTIIIPFIADQFFWGRQVYAQGIGPQPLSLKKLSSEQLTAAIQTTLTDQTMRNRAAKLGSLIRAEDGVGKAVQLITQEKHI